MKKSILCLVIVIMVFCFCSCNKNNEEGYVITVKGTDENYIATITLDDKVWVDLEKAEKVKIIKECVKMTETQDEFSEGFRIVGFEKNAVISEKEEADSQKIFEYRDEKSCAYFDGISVEL